MRSKVAIPVDDLTREQLIKELHRLDSELDKYERKTDQEVRDENKRLWGIIYQDGAQLESICTTLSHFGLGKYTHTDPAQAKREGGYMLSAGIQKLAYMKEEDRQAILEQRRRESEEFARREAERKAKDAA
jgi:hypothetical protein